MTARKEYFWWFLIITIMFGVLVVIQSATMLTKKISYPSAGLILLIGTFLLFCFFAYLTGKEYPSVKNSSN